MYSPSTIFPPVLYLRTMCAPPTGRRMVTMMMAGFDHASCSRRTNRGSLRRGSGYHSRSIACTVLLLLLLSLSACTVGENGGLFSNGNDLDTSPLNDETAAEVILFVYEQLNWFAMRTPETEGSSKSFADGTVQVTKSDSNDDIINAYYSDEVTVEFADYSFQDAEFSGTISGTGTVTAFIDSYNGSEGASYSGSFSGSYQIHDYELTMDYEATNSAAAGIQSSGTFDVNGEQYKIEADSSMIYDYFGM